MTNPLQPNGKKVPKLKQDFSNLNEVRLASGVNQSAFWARFGVTQSGGSRYENGRSIPLPLQILMMAYFSGLLTDVDLAKTKKALR